MNPEQFTHSLYHKRKVAIVGGHDDISWHLVNSCDTVIRINGHWARQGGRVDVLYDSCADDILRGFYASEEFIARCQLVLLNIMPVFIGAGRQYKRVCRICEEFGIPFDMYVHAPRGIWHTTEELRDPPPRHLWSKNFAEEYGYPFTGILAAAHVLSHEPASIYIDGMNFYGSTGRHSNHDINHQLEWLIEHFDTITPSISMLDILSKQAEHA